MPSASISRRCEASTFSVIPGTSRRSSLARLALDEDELERWGGDREVGVALLELGRCGVEQLGVERDGLVEVIDVQSELYAGHG